MRITFLGTGTSHGMPVIGCACPACNSGDPRDTRWRCSILVEDGGSAILVDAGPEFRLQAIRAGIKALDAVLITHAHADHIHGLDDLRPLARERSMPVYGDASAIGEILERFSYAFREGQQGGGKPRLDLRVVDSEAVRIGSLSAIPIPLLHGELPVSGWRFGSFAYLTDCSAIPESSVALLEGVRVAAIDALRFRPHPTHFSVEEAIALARRLRLETTWLTHICHDATHEELVERCAALGADVRAAPAWDGLVLKLPAPA